MAKSNFSKRLKEISKLAEEMTAIVSETNRAISRMKPGPEKERFREQFEKVIGPYFTLPPKKQPKLPHPNDITLLKEQANKCRLAGQPILQQKALAEAARLQAVIDGAKQK